jgi:hypothetical protein
MPFAMMAPAVVVPTVAVPIASIVAPLSMPVVIPFAIMVTPFAVVAGMMTFALSVPALVGQRGERQRKHRAPENQCKQPKFGHATSSNELNGSSMTTKTDSTPPARASVLRR